MSISEDDIKEMQKAMRVNPKQPWFGRVDFTPNELNWNKEQNQIFQEIKSFVRAFLNQKYSGIILDQQVDRWFNQRSVFTRGLKPLQIIELSVGKNKSMMYKLKFMVEMQYNISLKKRMDKGKKK